MDTEPIDYVLVRTPSTDELLAYEDRVHRLRLELNITLRVFEVAGRYHPNRAPVTEIRHVLWLLGEPGGMEPTPYMTHVLRAISAADPEQRDKLRAVYSTQVDLVDIAEYLLDGVLRLQALTGTQLRCGCMASVVRESGHLGGCRGAR